jgi:ATP-dependent RNA helicase RhlE
MEFESMGLAPRLVAKLAEQGINKTTPIQTQAIPHALNGRDVMGLAQTGTGKTLAFGLPLLQGLTGMGQKPKSGHVHGLVLAPTRELARQIFETMQGLTRGSHLKLSLVTGGASINRQIETCRRGVDLMVATPGRLIDLLDRKAVNLGDAQYLVLDEADQMLDMGFIHALRRIAPLLPKERQTMLFSATMPKLMADLSKDYLSDPVRVEVARPGVAADKVTQSVHFVVQSEKQGLLIELLREKTGRSLVFARTKHGSEKLMKNLVKAGLNASSIHGNKSQGQRDRAIRQFKSGEIDVLVATDVAARGIDIDDIAYVYNYDLPNVSENYVHRIGRTARAGRAGEAIAFCSPDEVSDLRGIQKVLKKDIPVASGKPWEEMADRFGAKKKPGNSNKRRRRPGKGRGMKRAA